MNSPSWKGKAFKVLSFCKRRRNAGRNSSGSITIYHRGGGSKRLQRRIDFQRHTLYTGIVQRIEYDPNRSANIALIGWQDEHKQKTALFTYVLAHNHIQIGDRILNHKHNEQLMAGVDGRAKPQDLLLQAAYPIPQPGHCVPLYNIPIGTLIHNIELCPGQGGRLVRSAGTSAQLVQRVGDQSVVRLPSGIHYLLHSRGRATIGVVSNASHNTRKRSKAGETRWIGRRPIVRGVAMNPVDHPHGGGEGRTKGGRPSVSPWGKPTKGGFSTVIKTHKARI